MKNYNIWWPLALTEAGCCECPYFQPIWQFLGACSWMPRENFSVYWNSTSFVIYLPWIGYWQRFSLVWISRSFFECVLLALVDDSGLLRVNCLQMAMDCPIYFIYIILHLCPSGVTPLLVSKLLEFGSLA